MATSVVAVLRDARKSALLRTRLIDDVDLIRTSETRYWERTSTTAVIYKISPRTAAAGDG
jgi:hypothetical protein